VLPSPGRLEGLVPGVDSQVLCAMTAAGKSPFAVREQAGKRLRSRMKVDMVAQGCLLGKPLLAVYERAYTGPFSPVYAKVGCQVTRLPEAAAAIFKRADIGPFVRMYAQVSPDVSFPFEVCGAGFSRAGIGSFFPMDTRVHLQLPQQSEPLMAVLKKTAIGLWSGMGVKVSVERCPLAEPPPTTVVRASIGLLPGVDAQVARQAGPPLETLATTVKRAVIGQHSGMNAQVDVQGARLAEMVLVATCKRADPVPLVGRGAQTCSRFLLVTCVFVRGMDTTDAAGCRASVGERRCSPCGAMQFPVIPLAREERRVVTGGRHKKLLPIGLPFPGLSWAVTRGRQACAVDILAHPLACCRQRAAARYC